jgi:hypothetical protein
MPNTEQVIRDYLKSEGWDVIYKLDVKRVREEHLINAFIDMDDWTISVRLDPQYERKLESCCSGFKIDHVAERAACAAIKHEFGHWEKCPFDVDYFEEIMDGVSTGLKSAGIAKEKIPELTFPIANMFMDLVVNTLYGLEDDEFRLGMYAFYLKEANLKKGGIGKGYPDGYGIFVDVQSKLYQIGDFRRLAEKFSNYGKIKADSQRIVALLTNEHIARKAFSNTLDEEDKRFVKELLEDRSKWRRKAAKFAQLISKYKIDTQMDSSFTRKFKKDRGFRREVIKRGIEKGHELLYAEKFDILDEIYDKESEEIILRFLGKKDTTFNFPLFWMKRERVEEDDKLDNIAWERTLFVDRGGEEEVWLFKKKVPYEIEVGRVVGPKSFEDILFIIDVSGSMDWSGEPLDGSKYDLAIRSVYGVVKYLEKIGKAVHLNYGLIQFGDRTTWSGWKSYWKLDELKRRLFEGYQGGTTELDPKKVEEAWNSRNDNFLTFMLSDGEIHENFDQAVSVCKKIIDYGNDFVLLQLQSGCKFASILKEYGAIVKFIDEPEDLVGLVLEKLKEKY